MSHGFNLVDAGWIPCVTDSGTVEFCGVFGALVRAHEFKELRDGSPLVTVALHRLLLAVLHRVFGPATPDAWADLWKAEHFPGESLEGYLRGPLYRRFDLFDEQRPFYQTASLPLGDIDVKRGGRPKYVKPVWQMAHELAYSDSMNLFAHFTEEDWEMRPPGEAARWLVAYQAFALGGRITFAKGENSDTEGSADAGQLTKSAVVLVRGDNVFQTLMLNLVQYNAEEDKPFSFKAERDRPAWERDEETRPIDRRYDGYLDLLTWQSRRVKLVPEGDPAGNLRGVSGVVTMKGYQLPDFARFGRETMVGFTKAEKPTAKQDPWPPLGFRLGKALWRDSHALFQRIADKTARPPVLSWVDDLWQDGHIQTNQIRLHVYGMHANQAKVLFWRHETLPLPLAYLHRSELVDTLHGALALAEDVGAAVRAGARAAAENRLTANPGMRPDTDRVWAVADSFAPDRLYWSRLERPFRELLVALADKGADLAAAVAGWYWRILHREGVCAFEQSIGRIDRGRDLKAVNAGRGVLFSRLKKVRTEHHIPEGKNEGDP